MPPAPKAKKTQQSKKAETELPPFLGRELRVELTDGRVVVGVLIAYEGSGDLLLQQVVEQRNFKDGETTVHAVSLLAIPFKHVKGLQRRLPGNELVLSTLEATQQQQQVA